MEKKLERKERWRKIGAAKKASLSEMAVNGGAKYSKAAHLWGFLPNRFESGENCTPSEGHVSDG